MTFHKDAAVLTQRELMHWRREPWAPLFSALFAVMLLLMFGYLFGGAIALAGGESYREYLVPGILALTMLFGLESTMTAVALDTRRGVTDRLRSLPITGVSVPAARAAADMLSSIGQLVVLLLVGLAIGWRTDAGPTAVLAAVALLLWLRLAVLWVGIYLGLTFRSEQAVVAVQVLVWPFAFLSGVFVPTDTLPAWLGALAAINPVSATAAACRDLFGNPSGAVDGLLLDHGLALAVAWPAVLLLVFVPLSARAFRNLSR